MYIVCECGMDDVRAVGGGGSAALQSKILNIVSSVMIKGSTSFESMQDF